MTTWVRTEVLGEQWVPPVAIGRAKEIETTVAAAESSREPPTRPGLAIVEGPAGSGSSTVARQAARRLADRCRAASADGRVRIVTVATRLFRSPHGVAAALVRSYDEGLDGRGFPWGDLLAGFLRRTRRDRRPTVVILDDLRVGGPDLLRLVRGLADPGRFLPEGESDLPPFYTLVAGTSESLRPLGREAAGRWALVRPVTLSPYSEDRLREIVVDRMVRATDRAAELGRAVEIAHRSFQEGGGASRAIDLLRREFGVASSSPGPVPSFADPSLPIEPHLRRALECAFATQGCEVKELHRWEIHWAHQAGRPPLATTTFWRRMVYLERRGWIRREVRYGGVGGSRTYLYLRRPVEEWFTDPATRGIRRGDGRVGAAEALA
jgi:hypothetical protein